ncbi:hypothetical protein, partial [Helicobacter fennelliae]
IAPCLYGGGGIFCVIFIVNSFMCREYIPSRIFASIINKAQKLWLWIWCWAIRADILSDNIWIVFVSTASSL